MSDRSRVVLLSSAHPAHDKRVFEKEARALFAAGLDVTHLCPAASGETVGVEVTDGIRIRRYRRAAGNLRRILGIPVLIREALREEADIYHCNEVDSWLAGLILAKLRGGKVVFDVHEHYPSVFASRYLPSLIRPLGSAFIRLLYRALAPLTDGLVFAKAAVAADFPTSRPATAVVRNLPPLRLIESHGESRPRRDGQAIAIHTGALRRARGWPQMLDALALTAQPGVTLRLVGGFTDRSRSDFDSRVAELELGHRVDVEPWLPFEDAFERLLDADIGLILFQPNIQNHVFASPHKLYDYMLAGLPVIGPAFAVEVARVVQQFDCGILVDSSNPAEIASALNRLASDGDLRRRMGERGRRAVLNDLNWEREAVRLLELYRRLGASLDV